MSYMKEIPGVPTRDQIRPGMAHFVGSGPKGAVCGRCDHFGYEDEYGTFQPMHCGAYARMMQERGPRIDPEYRACKYYEKTKP